MTVAEAMEGIESPRFSALANLASNLKTFVRIIAEQPEVRALQAEMATPEVTLQVCKRILVLSASPAEEGVEHPDDTAVAVYLWLLSHASQEHKELAARTVLDCKGFWWARKVAESILLAKQGSSTGFPSDGIATLPLSHRTQEQSE